MAEDAIDGKDLDYDKALASSVVSTVTFGLSKYGADKLSKAVTKHWWNRGNTNAVMRWLGRAPKNNVGQLVERATDVVNIGEALGVDKLYEKKQKVTELSEVTIHADKQKDGTYKTSDAEIKKAGKEIQQNAENNQK